MKCSILLKFLLINFLLVPTCYSLDDSWINNAHNVKSEDKKISENAIKAIQLDVDIDQKIIEALDKDEHIGEALLVIKLLSRSSLFLPLLNYAKKRPTSHAISTLVIQKKFDLNKNIFSLIKELSTSRWQELDSNSKLSTLFAVSALNVPLSLSQMKINLADPSDQVRITTARIAGKNLINQQDNAYAEIIKKSLASSPYQLRLEALYAIKNMPPQLKKLFMTEIGSCLLDTNETVKLLCSKIQREMKK